MNQRTLRIPGALKHSADEGSDATLQEKAREHVERHPGLQFLADVMQALHGSADPQRDVQEFFVAFPAKEMMEALVQRPDLRVRVVKAITGTPTALLRRLPPDALASQIDLLAVDDLPQAERSVRAEADRSLTVHELYHKYLEPVDVATYFPTDAIWRYEAQDNWWTAAPTPGTRALMAAELRSVRRRAIMTDSEILDLLGDETLETHLPLPVRTALRKAARRAAAEGRPFTDADMFAGAGGSRDLIDEMVDSVPWAQLREVIVQVAAAMLGYLEPDAAREPAKAAPASGSSTSATPPPVVTSAGPSRVGPKTSPPLPPPAKNGSGAQRAGGKSLPHVGSGKGDRPAMPEEAAPPQPDDDLAFVEEVSGRI
jgi:hypothetical protein